MKTVTPIEAPLAEDTQVSVREGWLSHPNDMSDPVWLKSEDIGPVREAAWAIAFESATQAVTAMTDGVTSWDDLQEIARLLDQAHKHTIVAQKLTEMPPLPEEDE